MNNHQLPLTRRNTHPPRRPLPPSPAAAAARKSDHDSAGNGKISKPTSPNHSVGERTVKKLRTAKPLTVPEGTTILEACKRMSARRVDAALITDSNGLLSGIITAEDISKRVIAEGIRPEQTNVSRAMTKNPVFIMADSPAIEAMQKMVQGKFRHLPVVENGEVIAMMDITKFLYDAISGMERVAEQGHAIAAAVEGVERQLGSDTPARHAFMEGLWERMFKPSLSTIISENTSVPVVSPSDSVYLAAQKMRDYRVNSVVVLSGDTLQGILTSKDVLLRVVALNMAPEFTHVDKVMTTNPECANLDTPILDALHSMHDGKFLHIPVLDRDGHIAACLDVLQLTHAAISMVEGSGGSLNDMANTMMHKFWNSTFALQHQEEEYDNHSEMSVMMGQEFGEGKYMSPPHVINSFVFKLEDKRGRVHRFSCISESLEELISAVKRRIGIENEKERLQLLYEDDEGDKVLLMTDSDLVGAVYHARSAGWKVLRIHIDSDSDTDTNTKTEINTIKYSNISTTTTQNNWSALQMGVMTSAIAAASVGLMIFLKHSRD